MENVDKNQMQQQLSEMKLQSKDLQKELERSIELFKQMEFEQKLQENIDKLNELGASGWEVVSVLPASGTKDEHARAILKRQKAPGRLV